jgi:hypothetical protein
MIERDSCQNRFTLFEVLFKLRSYLKLHCVINYNLFFKRSSIYEKNKTLFYFMRIQKLALSLVCLSSTVCATDQSWVGLSGSVWSDTNSWNPSGAPGTGDVANIGSGGNQILIGTAINQAQFINATGAGFYTNGSASISGTTTKLTLYPNGGTAISSSKGFIFNNLDTITPLDIYHDIYFTPSQNGTIYASGTAPLEFNNLYLTGSSSIITFAGPGLVINSSYNLAGCDPNYGINNSTIVKGNIYTKNASGLAYVTSATMPFGSVTSGSITNEGDSYVFYVDGGGRIKQAGVQNSYIANYGSRMLGAVNSASIGSVTINNTYIENSPYYYFDYPYFLCTDDADNAGPGSLGSVTIQGGTIYNDGRFLATDHAGTISYISLEQNPLIENRADFLSFKSSYPFPLAQSSSINISGGSFTNETDAILIYLENAQVDDISLSGSISAYNNGEFLYNYRGTISHLTISSGSYTNDSYMIYNFGHIDTLSLGTATFVNSLFLVYNQNVDNTAIIGTLTVGPNVSIMNNNLALYNEGTISSITIQGSNSFINSQNASLLDNQENEITSIAVGPGSFFYNGTNSNIFKSKGIIKDLSIHGSNTIYNGSGSYFIKNDQGSFGTITLTPGVNLFNDWGGQTLEFEGSNSDLSLFINITGGSIYNAWGFAQFYAAPTQATITITGTTEFINYNNAFCLNNFNGEASCFKSLIISGTPIISSYQNTSLPNPSLNPLFIASNVNNNPIELVSISGGSIFNGSSSYMIFASSDINKISISGGTIYNRGNFACGDSGYINEIEISGNPVITNLGFDENLHSYFASNTSQSHSLGIGTITVSGGSIYNDNYANFATALSDDIAKISISNQAEIFNGSTSVFGAVVLGFMEEAQISGHPAITNNGFFFPAFAGYVGTISISGGSIYNAENAFFAFANGQYPFFGLIGTISIEGGSIINDGYLAISDPSANNGDINQLYISGGTVFNSRYFATAITKMTGGHVTNNGSMSCYSNSSQLDGNYFSGGILDGTGTLYVAAESNQFTTPVQQRNVIVGKFLSFDFITSSIYEDYPGNTLYATLDSILDADLDVYGLSDTYFQGNGTITGTCHIFDNVYLSPGNDFTPDIAKLTVLGNLIVDGGAYINMDFGDTTYDQIPCGNNIILNDNPILHLNAFGSINQKSYVLFPFINPLSGIDYTNLEILTQGQITGTFTLEGYQPLLDLGLKYVDGKGIILGVSTLPFTTQARTPNQFQVALALDALNGNTNSCLQDKIEQMQLLTEAPLQSVLDTLDPSELKGHQIVLEEMTFVMNDEFSTQLYKHHKGLRPFALFGYEYLSQKSYSQFAGYHSNAGFELLGLSYGFDSCQVAASLGSLQASTKYHYAPSISKSTSIIGAAGLSGFKKRFSFGIDALFGYHFISNRRTIGYFDLKSRSNHGGYSLKTELNSAYTKAWSQVALTPYEKLGYYYGYENSFKEHGGECLSLNVQSSHSSVLRNTLGFQVETNIKKPLNRHLHVIPYLDVSWVWQNNFADEIYKSQFINTSPTMTIEGIGLTRNFGKVLAGLTIKSCKWSSKVGYNGMWGKRFSEQGASITFDRKF